MIRNFSSTVGLQKVETEGTQMALGGETDCKIFPDYRNVSVLSAFKPLSIEIESKTDGSFMKIV